MEEQYLSKIADALERIAIAMENSEKREINILKNIKSEEAKSVKETLRKSAIEAKRKAVANKASK